MLQQTWSLSVVLVVLARPLGVIIGERDKPGSKRRMRAQTGGPSVRTRNQATRTLKQEASTRNQASSNKIQEICVCHCVQNEGIAHCKHLDSSVSSAIEACARYQDTTLRFLQHSELVSTQGDCAEWAECAEYRMCCMGFGRPRCRNELFEHFQ